ncbi:MAG TPA: phosphatidylserine/phosphatidylglycerophosphate/cardiolipin synthase family protein [Spirochaetales bacterium]|nr:phosphatidylserine/phosphatidylglycerophosphate/cardiolipin synthase family protein [Spirochaetales bacterium]HRY53157.1 phosphatidylserine/phosphatidylglycerophosphate/cardiolipin synthase family protein [Spirochaetia bacterium]HRZ63302.1 phosphatidylserine/phosphatidylglycerophosphate/cardiolipin synthase family protein [Spirochaetia bacterium]
MSRSRAVAALSLALLAASCASAGRARAPVQATAADPAEARLARIAAAARILDEAGMPAYGSSPLSRLSMDGREWTERSLELIAGARDYVLVCSFLLTEHPNAELVLAALAEARARGVRVYLLVDSASYYRTYPMSLEPVPAAVGRARELGLPIAEYNPIRGRRIFTLLGLLDRDHRKFWVVDGRVAAVGGQNVDHDSLRYPSEAGCIDAMAEFASPGAVAELRDSFVDTWNAFSSERLEAGSFPVAEGRGPEPAELRLVDQGLPRRAGAEGGAGRTTAMFDALFARAGSELLLLQCYAFPTPALLERIRQARARGVRVRAVLSAGHVSQRFVSGTYYGIAKLQDAGAEVYLFESPERNLLHMKMIMADGEMAAIGSANYNFRSQALSREASVVFSDPASLELVAARLRELEPWFRPVGREEAEGYRTVGNLLAFLLMQVAG